MLNVLIVRTLWPEPYFLVAHETPGSGTDGPIIDHSLILILRLIEGALFGNHMRLYSEPKGSR